MKKQIAEAHRRDKALRDTIVATIAALNGDPLRLAADDVVIEKRKPYFLAQRWRRSGGASSRAKGLIWHHG
jgi:hypothetical protein